MPDINYIIKHLKKDKNFPKEHIQRIEQLYKLFPLDFYIKAESMMDETFPMARASYLKQKIEYGVKFNLIHKTI
jgi:hypothetical protein